MKYKPGDIVFLKDGYNGLFIDSSRSAGDDMLWKSVTPNHRFEIIDVSEEFSYYMIDNSTITPHRDAQQFELITELDVQATRDSKIQKLI